MLNKLPNELIYVICEKLDLNSINNIKYTNIKLYNVINGLSNSLLKNECKKFHKKLKAADILTSLENFCKIIINKYTYNSYKNTSYKLKNPLKNLTNYIEKNNLNNICLYNISYNLHVNKLFKNILDHFIYYETLKNYDKIKLLFLYNFIQIEQFNIFEIDYYIDFIENITYNKYYKKYDDIIINYYSFIIKILNFENTFLYEYNKNYTSCLEFLSFENLYKISKWIITPHMMQKLISYKPLNLDTSELKTCCNICFKKPIEEIVKVKFNMREDELIGHNFLCINNILLKNTNKTLPNSILLYIRKIQKTLVNQYIYIIDPKTNKPKKLKNNELHYNMIRIINKKQNYLINKIFN
jgi:hypothetical protein